MLCDRGRRNEAGTLAGGEGGRPAAPRAPPTTGKKRGGSAVDFTCLNCLLLFDRPEKQNLKPPLPSRRVVSATVRFFIHLRPQEEEKKKKEKREYLVKPGTHAARALAPPPAHVTGEGGGTMLLLLRQNK